MRIMPRNGSRDLPVPPPVPKRYYDDVKWLRAHRKELAEQHPDEWVAVFAGRLVAAGTSLGEVLRAAQQETGERDIVVELVSPSRKFYPSGA